jgi:tryptophan synthase alpha chain
MNRIDARFAKLKDEGKAAFIPFFTAGDPDRETTLRLMREAEVAGADVIELGIPFSDPIADGLTIQNSYHRALESGQTVGDVFEIVREARGGSRAEARGGSRAEAREGSRAEGRGGSRAEAREGCRLPVVAMVSYSIVFRMGFEGFVARALTAGIDGATIPDLPVDEAEGLFAPAEERGFRLICFVAPSTTGARRGLVVRRARGFIYYMSVKGITGERALLAPDLFENLRELKALTRVPVAVGFGISRPEQAKAVAQAADGVIVGSAIVKRMADARERGEDPAEVALEFIHRMSAAVKS